MKNKMMYARKVFLWALLATSTTQIFATKQHKIEQCFWVVESNISDHNTIIIKFYEASRKLLIYEENLTCMTGFELNPCTISCLNRIAQKVWDLNLKNTLAKQNRIVSQNILCQNCKTKAASVDVYF